ncbi:MAG: OmpA family protein [Kiloniellaceae bacterium]
MSAQQGATMTEASIDFARPTGGSRRFVTFWAGVLSLPLLLGACSVVPDWADPSRWFGEDVSPGRVAQGEDGAGPSESPGFPNLASVPDSAPRTSPSEERARIQEGLTADRASAQYSGERLTGGVAAAPAPVPLAKAPDQPAGIRQIPTRQAAPQVATVPEPPAVPDGAAQPFARTPLPATGPQRTPMSAPLEPAEGGAPAGPPEPQLRFPQQSPGPAGPGAGGLPGRTELVGVVYFAHGSAALDANDRRVLRDIVTLHRQRGGSIRVVGHASARTAVVDALRHSVANFEMSWQRANAVAAALVELGAERDKVRAEARSDSQPVYHEFMPTGEAGNRRAEVFLEY